MQTQPKLIDLQSLLSPSGCFYLVAVKENNPPEIMKRMDERFGLKSEVSDRFLSSRYGG